jgi:hypothetical protein
MVVNSLNEFSGDNTSTTTTLTPTTLKHITQIFESEDCLKSLQTFEQSGFVPPPPPQQQPQQFNIKQRGVNNNFYCGGTTTVVTPIKEEPLATLLPKIENEFSDYSENSIFDEDYDEEYQPAAKKTMQTRNGGVKRSNSRKEPVQRKRKGNMKDDYDGLPPSERNRLIMRRERNKQAAARCRQRREDLTKSLMLEVKHWEGKKDELEDEIRMLRSQKEELEHILSQHNATCGFMSQQTVQQIVAVKSEPGVIVESVEAPYAIQEPKRHRPSSLTLPFTSYIEQDGPDGVLIETPSTVIPSFDNFMTSTGLTPVVTSISTPMFYSSCGSLNTPVSCAYQQRSREVPDLNTPGETVSLVSL